MILYTTEACPNCKIIKKELDDANIEYTINENIEEMKSLGIKVVPVLRDGNKLLDYKQIIDLINSNPRKLMADAKFYEGYSRYIDEDSRYETWKESIDRVMSMHRKFYKDKMTPELDDLFKEVQIGYSDKLFLGAQRGLQFGGDQLLSHHARLYNCFEENTKFITNLGVKSFKDFKEGDECIVKTHKGNWKKAKVKTYGRQDLYKIKFKKGSNENNYVLATKDHRWILKNGDETTSLKNGDKLYQIEDSFVEFKWDESSDIEKLYWCYGLVYGDGTVGGNGYSKIRLCDHDRKYEYRFLELGFSSSSSASLNGDILISTGSYKKTAPNPEVDSPELIRAFVHGYMSADGYKNRSKGGKQFNSIQSSEVSHIEFIRRCFPIAGVYILKETDLTGQETNFGIRPYTISFSTYEGARFTNDKSWTVEDIEYHKKDIVWCLEVEDDESFVMPNGIVTGNCSASYCDRPNFFGEMFYLLLCGAGVGFSVQKEHIRKLPNIKRRTNRTTTYIVPDSIEGWASSVDVLLSCYFEEEAKHPEYKGKKVHFDLTQIRPKGSFISGGFKAPGGQPLREALDKIENMLDQEINNGETKLRTIVAYDICMYIADAVISGGVRRSATICMFSKDDEDMIKSKTGDWWETNPQRGRSNNSVTLLRDDTTFEEFETIIESVKDYGEPGFIWTDSEQFVYNPCVEVGMKPQTKDGRSGFQVCNLTEINGGKSKTKEVFFKQCKLASILGTIQAGYTDFKFLSKETKEIVDKEALIGVGITGMMNNPNVLFNPEIQKEGARIVKYWNKVVADMIGINQASRTTVIKPSGNSAVLLECSSGVHGEHAPKYFRHVQFNKDTEVAQLFMNNNPAMCEDSVYNKERDTVVAFPIEPSEKSIFKESLLGVEQLEYVRLTQQNWIEEGTNVELCVDKRLRHNVSNTITVDDWKGVTKYIYDNRNDLCGVSLLSSMGDKAYVQAPFTEVFDYDQIVSKYGEVALYTSALIEAGLNAFDKDLWRACNTALGYGETLKDSHEFLLKRDFVRRFNKFSDNFKSKLECSNCLKDVYNLHKWWKIHRDGNPIQWDSELSEKVFVDIDTMGAQACSGGQCEI